MTFNWNLPMIWNILDVPQSNDFLPVCCCFWSCWFRFSCVLHIKLKSILLISFSYYSNLSATLDVNVKNQILGVISVDRLTARVNTTFYAELSPQQDVREFRNNKIHIELLHSGAAFCWHVFNITNLYFKIQ